MKSLFDCIIENKEWLFSGLGLAIIGIILKKKSLIKKNIQKSGNNSIQIQDTNGDVNLKNKP